MEMDELKNMWSVMDEKLRKQELLNESIIREMMTTKGNKSLNKLIAYEVLGFSICLLVIPLVVYFSRIEKIKPFILWDILMYVALIFCSLYCIWAIWKLFDLFKMDFNKKISTNVNLVNKYDIKIKYEKIFMLFFMNPLLFILCVLCYAEINVTIELWVFLFAVFFICIGFSIWSYRKLYPKLIGSIKQSFDRLEELKEEKED